MVTNPTCTEKGYTRHFCVNCGNEYRDSETPELGHSIRIQTIQPNCTEQGCDICICERCGYNYERNVVKALGHRMVTTSLSEPTCTHEGYAVTTCSVCSAQKRETLSVLPHADNNGDGYCDYGCGTYLGGSSTPGEQGDICKYCGKVHTGPLGGLLKFFHNIAYFFAHLFGKK